MYNVVLKKSAEKDLNSIKNPYFNKILQEIENLTLNPRNHDVKKLISKDNEYRLKVGDYRVLFYIEEIDKKIIISRILHRKDSYKN